MLMKWIDVQFVGDSQGSDFLEKHIFALRSSLLLFAAPPRCSSSLDLWLSICLVPAAFSPGSISAGHDSTMVCRSISSLVNGDAKAECEASSQAAGFTVDAIEGGATK